MLLIRSYSKDLLLAGPDLRTTTTNVRMRPCFRHFLDTTRRLGLMNCLQVCSGWWQCYLGDVLLYGPYVLDYVTSVRTLAQCLEDEDHTVVSTSGTAPTSPQLLSTESTLLTPCWCLHHLPQHVLDPWLFQILQWGHLLVHCPYDWNEANLGLLWYVSHHPMGKTFLIDHEWGNSQDLIVAHYNHSTIEYLFGC